MAYLDVLKEVQETTLTHERLLNRLRSELSKFSRGSSGEESVKELVEDLRHNRRAYLNLTVLIYGKGKAPNSLSEDVYTLLEYNILVAFNNELELLSKVSKYVREGRMKLMSLEDLLNDIETVNNIINHFSRAINAARSGKGVPNPE